MKEIILLKNGEIALKGANKSTFENVLIKNIRSALAGFGEIKISKAQSTIFVEPLGGDYDITAAAKRLSSVFGIAALSRAAVVEKDMPAILAAIPAYFESALKNAETFKVEAKRADKKFPLNSMEICVEAGAVLLEHYPHLKVDVKNPEVTAWVEIRDSHAYIHTDQQRGAGGLPVGTGGSAAILLSGGIDSPVAAYMLAKRGVSLTAIHFSTPPYTSPGALDKVRELAAALTPYTGAVNFANVPLTDISEAISRQCPDDLTTLIMRRYMMKIASIIAREKGCDALVTGESIGQVASQTMKALLVTDDASTLPVFRPLIGMDKSEIIEISQKIGTFDISIKPFEDCCTVFTPKHPRTKPKLDIVKQAEVLEDGERLVQEALRDTSYEVIGN